MAHLLTHTSGIDGDIFTDTGRGDDCVQRYAGLLDQAASVFSPGGAYSYSNSGYVLAGRIIEVLDGRTWDESLRERLCGPLELNQTVTLPEEAILHRAAVGHYADGGVVRTWALPRSIGPAGLITAAPHDLLTFARFHLDGGVAPNSKRLLSEAVVALMQKPQAAIPGFGTAAGAVGFGWRLSRWDGRVVIGHDGDTIGQSAYLRVDPEARVTACLLTNSAETATLYRQVFGEVFADLTGAALPADPGPADADPGGADPGGPGLDQHAGRYERTSRRYDITVRDGRLHMVLTITGELAALTAAEPEQLVLFPADSSGANFVCRSRDDEPWVPLSFGELAGGTPHLFMSGRVTPRVG